MTAVRPPLTPTPATTARPAVRSNDAARAAQRAFFQAALGDAQPTAAATTAKASQTAQPVRAAPQAAATSPVRPAQAATTTAQTSTAKASTSQADDPPQRLLRPGSLIDIRV